jgi:D-cysteine desulfhydrase
MTDTVFESRFESASTLPRLDLATLPTPVEPLESLGNRLDIPEFYVKRDDATGPLYGGNKVRKLEYLLGEARVEGHERVWTVGGIGSHHVLATCIYARQQGFEPAALHFPQPVTEHVLDNLRALSTTRPDVTLVGNRVQIPVEVLRTRIREWLARGPEVYYIPAGGSSPTGAVGYVHAVCELAEQIEAGDVPEPDVIFVAAGTCGTVAGILAGTQLLEIDSEIVAVRVVDRLITNMPSIRSLAKRTLERLADHGISTPDAPDTDRVTLLHDYFGDSYGTPTAEATDAIEAARAEEELELDPTYTGKTVAALIGERDRFDLADRAVLYWHTLNGIDLSERIQCATVEEDLPEDYRPFFDGTFEE